MPLPQSINLPATYEGTTWEGISSIELDLPGNVPVPLVGASLSMTFRRVGERQVRLELGIGTGIVITDAAAGLVQVLPQVLPLPAGLYYHELIMTQASGVVLPLFVGVLPIEKVGVPA